jgi:hypothetical protein
MAGFSEQNLAANNVTRSANSLDYSLVSLTNYERALRVEVTPFFSRGGEGTRGFPVSGAPAPEKEPYRTRVQPESTV